MDEEDDVVPISLAFFLRLLLDGASCVELEEDEDVRFDPVSCINSRSDAKSHLHRHG